MPRFSFKMFRLLVGLCGAETETLAVVRNFTFFTGTSNGSETFLHYLSIQIVYFVLMFQNFWSNKSMVDVQISTDCPV